MKSILKLERIVLGGLCLLLCAQASAETLIYSLSYAETPTSMRARFPNGAIGASIDKQLAMLRKYRKTEIHSVSLEGKSSLLFSDEGMNFEISPQGTMLGAGKALMTGVEREWRTSPTPGAYASSPALYEISLDGSKQIRRLIETMPNQGPVLLNSMGTKVVSEAFVDGRYIISIYDTATWKVLESWDLDKLIRARCPDCLPMSYGWMVEGDRLFFNLDIGDEDGIESETHDVPGTYIASSDGSKHVRMQIKHGELQLAGYTRRKDLIPYLIGQLPGGENVFHDYAVKDGAVGNMRRELQSFLVLTHPNGEDKRQLLLGASRISSYYLSPTGKYVAYIEERQVPNFRTERHVWGKDLRSGDEVELFVVQPVYPLSSTEPKLTLTVLGWVQD
ncbi:MAG TPA: hypothetical protein VM578_07765 [Candidatus Saccharimonadales bacterium]|nr:hypothetical protein [Candidatus Saccharimonadales bacterium]